MSFAELYQYLQNPNVAAFLRVIRAGESNQQNDAYLLLNGGGHFTDWSKHPFDGVPTTQGGKAAGAYQFLGTTWKALRESYDLPDFGPTCQDCGAVALIFEHGALDDVRAGDLKVAVERLGKTWVSLPSLGDKVWDIFKAYGGGVGGTAPAPDPTQSTPASPRGSMGLLAILAAVGPALGQLISQIATATHPDAATTPRGAQTAQTILNAVAQAAGTASAAGVDVGLSEVAAAIDKMHSDPSLVEKVTQAVVNDPQIIGLLEVGEGGIGAARNANAAAQGADKPFWYNPAVWVSLVLIAMPFMLLVDVFYMHPDRYDGNLRTQIVTAVLLIISMVGAYWLGTSAGSARKTELAAQQGQPPAA